MRTSLMLSLLASTSFAAACGGGAPKTPQELGDRLVAALVAKDWDKAKALYWSADEFVATCADVPEEKRGKLKEELAEEMADAEKDFKECLSTDWAGAKVVEVKGGEGEDAVEGCGGKALEAKDVVLKVEVAGKTMELKANDPLKVGDNYFLIEGIRCKAPEMTCEDVYDNLSKIVLAATEAKDREKEMFSGTAEKKTEFVMMCGEMKSRPMFGAVIDCMGNAKSYAEMTDCEKKMREDGGAGDKQPEAVAVADAPAAPAAGGACEKYVAKMTACADAMPEPTREQMKKGLQSMKDALGARTPDEQNVACGAALEAAGKAMAQMCPTVSWD